MNWHLVPIESKPFSRATALGPGDRVQLRLAAGEATPAHHMGKADDELVWVEVASKIEEVYAGKVITQRPATKDVSPEDVVYFEAKHVHQFGERTSWLKRLMRRIR